MNAVPAQVRSVFLLVVAIAASMVIVVGSFMIFGRLRSQVAVNAVPVGIDELPSEDLTLADDTVVVRSNNGKAVRDLSPDGSQLTLAADAEGAEALQPGKVLLLTGVTAMRVDKLERRGDTIVIQAKPARITDIIKDGKLSFTKANLDMSQASLRVYAPEPRLVEQEGAAGGDAAVNELFRPSARGGGGGGGSDGYTDIPLAQDSGGNVARSGTVSGWEYRFNATIAGDTVTFTLHLTKELSGVQVTIDVDGSVSGVGFAGDLEISAASVRQFRLQANDLRGQARITASASVEANTRFPVTVFHVPMSMQVPFPVSGIPFTVGIEADLRAELAFTSAQAGLTGAFDARFSGSGTLAVNNGSLAGSGTFEQLWEDPIESVEGLSIGPAAMIITVQFPKVSLGIGIALARASAYFEFIYSYGPTISGTTNFVPCRSAPVSMTVNAGITAEFLGREIPVAEREIVNRNAAPFDPPVAACRI